MATPGILVTEFARILGLPENAVVRPWRVLRDAGEVSKGARGRNAVLVTADDAAKLLIAVASDMPLKSILDGWRQYAILSATHGTWTHLPQDVPLPSLRRLPKEHTLIAALAALIEDARDEHCRKSRLQLSIDFRWLSWPQAFVSMQYGDEVKIRVDYDGVAQLSDAYAANPKMDLRAERGDMQYQRCCGSKTIFGLGALLSEEVDQAAVEQAGSH